MKKTISKILGVALAIALLVSMVIGVIPVGASSVSTPSVSLTGTTISSAGTYTVTFVATTQLTTGVGSTDNIVITLPTGTNATTITAVTVGYSSGIGTNANAAQSAFAATILPVSSTVTQTVTIGLTNVLFTANIGAGATVQVVLTGVTNPGTAGTTYTLTVATSKDTTAVTSGMYSITNPAPNDIPGLVQGYNAAGVLLNSWSAADAINTAIGYAGVTKVVVGDGTYDITLPITPLAGQTIVSVNGAGTTIIKEGTAAPWNAEVNLTAAGVTFGGVGTGFTVTNTSTFTGTENVVLTSAATATATTINSCIINTVKTTVPAILRAITLTGGATTPVSVVSCMINTNVSSGFAADGIAVTGSTTAASVTLSKDIFYIDAGENAINVISSTSGLTIDSCIFNAAPANTGTGVLAAGALASVGTISNNTFTSLLVGISVTNAAANLTIGGGNKFNTCGTAAGTTDGAISMTATGTIAINNNTFSGNVGYSIYISAAGTMSATGNVFGSDVKGVNVTAGLLTAPLNYWGAATGPNTTGAEIVATVPTFVTVAPFSPAMSNSVTGAVAGGVSAKSTVGVVVSGTAINLGGVTTTVASFGVTNPQTIAPPYTTNAAYYDVYNNITAPGTFNVQFYASGINSSTLVYFYSPLLGQWAPCNNVTISGDFSYALLIVTATSSPNTGDFSNTVFAVVNGPVVIPPVTYVNLITPITGSTTNMLTNIPFAWAPVTGATAYTFVLSPNADLSNTLVVKSTTSPVYTYTGTLVPGPYYWQVTASVGSTDIKSLPGVFIVQAPVTPPATTITTVINTTVVTTQPITTTSTVVTTTQTVIQSTQTTITNTNTSTQVTPSWIWGIIGIGAILIIVVIVLIVRTRRTV